MKKGIISILSAMFGAATGAVAVGRTVSKNLRKKDDGLRKVHELYMAFDQWLRIRQEGRTLIEYFHAHNYNTVAIYGMKELGVHLYEELKDSDITVCYAIDQNADAIYADIDIVTPDEELTPVDVIIVTAIYYFDGIEKMLREKVNYPVVSLKDILYKI